ncbi:hypothetical protein PsorP6_010364 [Peronosclerospora sorghi]|uniref:Uncharacterized protein n=1 Tax=Peronosclerospora sorghi TaxID=230839 RepID=A0ACC0VXF7_9STRA|nr:hypothetical protein PsorP6_010364 [Peronosclerospora sorghi]
MKNLLNLAGFEAMYRNSPIIRNFSTLKDLAKEFVKYMPRIYKYPNEAEDEVSAPTSDDVCESGDEEKSSPSSRDSIRQVVDVAQGILTGSPKEDEAVVFPSVQSRPNEDASEDIVSDIRRGALVRLLDERYQIIIPLNLFVEAAEALGGQKVFAGSGSTLALQKQRACRVDGTIRSISALMVTTSAATRSLPHSLGEERCSYMYLTVSSSVNYWARPTESGGW